MSPLANVLSEPTALVLRTSELARDFMHAMGCEEQLVRCTAQDSQHDVVGGDGTSSTKSD
jgi:hypothetical protein